jgi:hypothetical protein
MGSSRLVQRITERLHALPVWLRWIEHCDPSVLEAYRSLQRVMVARQLPIVVGACLAGAALKASGVVRVGHPVVLALFAVALAALFWPPSVAHLGRTAWLASSSASAFRAKLRVLAVAAYLQAALSAVLIAVVTGLVVATVLL